MLEWYVELTVRHTTPDIRCTQLYTTASRGLSLLTLTWDSERELLHSAPKSYQIRWNNAK